MFLKQGDVHITKEINLSLNITAEDRHYNQLRNILASMAETYGIKVVFLGEKVFSVTKKDNKKSADSPRSTNDIVVVAKKSGVKNDADLVLFSEEIARKIEAFGLSTVNHLMG